MTWSDFSDTLFNEQRRKKEGDIRKYTKKKENILTSACLCKTDTRRMNYKLMRLVTYKAQWERMEIRKNRNELGVKR